MTCIDVGVLLLMVGWLVGEWSCDVEERERREVGGG